MDTTVSKTRIAEEFDRARVATDALLEPLSDAELRRQVSPLQSPLVWDYAHIAYFEELWLARGVGGADPIMSGHDDIYDAFQHARDERGELPLLDPASARAYATDVRARTLEVLDRIELDRDDPLHRDGFVFGMVLQHELQHQETLLQTLQLRDEPYPIPDGSATNGAVHPDSIELLVGGGVITLGTSVEPWAYDNERQAHELELPDFRIDSEPVTNARYLEFVLAGGYENASVWSEAGWAWRVAETVTLPLNWRRDGDEITRVRFGHVEPLPPHEPVQHVSFFEAEAFARWAGKRLPTEQEWEKAALSVGPSREHGNRATFGPRPAVATAPQLGGDVWEWTSSHFLPYPGFAAFPYAEYSEVFFGDAFRVLRGGSWATDPLVARPTFRNWDYPQRRQIFAGFRCASDV